MKDTDRQDEAGLTDPARLEALAETGLMDTVPEALFDRAVRLATRLLGAKVSLLSLVDDERQFFKAQTGLEEPYATTRETPLSHSFCQHVVRTAAPLVVSDARKDPLLQSNLAIPDLGVIAYLGVPVRAPGGEVLGSFCAIEGTARDWTDEDVEILTDIAASVESEIALRSVLKQRQADADAVQVVRERLDLALQSGNLGTYDLDMRSGQVTWDGELYSIWGISEEVGNPLEAAMEKVHPDDRAANDAAFAAAKDPAGDGRYAIEMRVMKDGPDDVRWVSSTGIVKFDGAEPVRMVGTVRDISDRRAIEDQNLLLTQELNHRVKNLFAITNGLIALTARDSGSVAEMRDKLRSRIVSLSAAHDLVRPAITREHQKDASTDLITLCKTILDPHRHSGSSLALDGPSIALSPQAASSLALVLHELATNAGKYGALSTSTGTVTLRWTLEDGALSILWAERGGPAVKRSEAEAGFGSTLIDLTIERQLKGNYQMDWDAEGLTCRLSIPWKS